jgi:DNA/RNA-binding domain of Phe-tRNA-synthetase-like protein
MMLFCHSTELRDDFPELVAGVLLADGITNSAPVDVPVADFSAVAGVRLSNGAEGEMPEIQAWRRTFSRMGLKPTQYRCASESLLRRFRQENALPRLHPLVDLCNAASMAFAIPVAVFDVARIAGNLEVRRANGEETYLTFSGQTEHPEAGEVIFADDACQAHARRWTNRQSGLSAVRDATRTVLIVTEAMHASAPADIRILVDTLAGHLGAVWPAAPKTAILDRASPRFGF